MLKLPCTKWQQRDETTEYEQDRIEEEKQLCPVIFNFLQGSFKGFIDFNRDETWRGPNEKQEYKSVYMNEEQQYSGWSFPGKRSQLSLGLDRLNY